MTMITTIRIPASMDKKIQSICESKHLTKSKLFREAMQFYIDKKLPLSQPLSNTDSRFGKYGSGTKNRSTQYKTLLKAKLREKNSR